MTEGSEEAMCLGRGFEALHAALLDQDVSSTGRTHPRLATGLSARRRCAGPEDLRHKGEVSHRSGVVEHRVKQHRQKLADRLKALRV